MSCSCHINPPCGWCEQTYECDGCARLLHPDEYGQNEVCNKMFCDSCVDATNEVQERIQDSLKSFIGKPNTEFTVQNLRSAMIKTVFDMVQAGLLKQPKNLDVRVFVDGNHCTVEAFDPTTGDVIKWEDLLK